MGLINGPAFGEGRSTQLEKGTDRGVAGGWVLVRRGPVDPRAGPPYRGGRQPTRRRTSKNPWPSALRVMR